MRRTGLNVAKCFANGRKCLTEKSFSSPLACFVGTGIIRLKPNAPHWVQRTSLSQKLVAIGVEKVILHGWIMPEFVAGAT